MASLQACTAVNCETKDLSNGTKVDYCLGKVANAGQEATFRDAYIDGKLVVDGYAGGQSLLGAAFGGAVGNALLATGIYAGAKALRPDRVELEQSYEGSYEGSLSNSNSVSNDSSNTNSASAQGYYKKESPKTYKPKHKKY